MRDVFEMWKETRMVVLTAVIAAIYAVSVMILKVATIVPGFTEFRPGVAFAVFCSLLFGPAAAWGAAFGNLISDFFGTLGLGSIFGFLGNFLFGLIPYKIYRIFCPGTHSVKSAKQWISIIFASIIASLVCGFTIGWGVDLLGFVPFQILAGIISLNNVIATVIFVPILIVILYDRIRAWGLLYQDILPENLTRPSAFSLIGLVLIVIGAVGGLTFGLLAGFHIITVEYSLKLILTPFVLCVLTGTVLL